MSHASHSSPRSTAAADIECRTDRPANAGIERSYRLDRRWRRASAGPGRAAYAARQRQERATRRNARRRCCNRSIKVRRKQLVAGGPWIAHFMPP